MKYLFSIDGALDHPVTRWTVILVGSVLVLTPLAVLILSRTGRMSEKTRADVWVRYRTWLWLAPAGIAPIVICPASAMVLVLFMSLVSYHEYARATGLFRRRGISVTVVAAIAALSFACFDNWYGLFVALNPLAITVLVATSVLADEPKGYIQRVALAAVGYLLFGSGLQHLAFMANDANYRPILCMLFVCVQASDILAYICGKAFGRRKLFPHTSPNKTLGGHLGALVLVAPLAAWLAHLVFPGSRMDRPHWLILFGLIVAAGAQLGDLVLGSIKRDLGIKDMAATLPGHGGFLDRINSTLLVAPAAFYFIRLFEGFHVERAVRVFSGP